MTEIANKIGYVYKIVCLDPEIKDCYVGSCQSFRTRKSCHKHNCTNTNHKNYNMNVYRFIRANGGWVNFSMIVIEQVEYKIKHELLLRERFHLENLKATLNKQIPTRTRKEKVQKYSEEGRYKVRQHNYLKKWRENNQDKIKKNNDELYTCECYSIGRKNHHKRHLNSKNHKQFEQIYNFIHS